jgi:hypothetical protein
LIMNLSTLNMAPKIDAILSDQNINGFEAPGGTDKQTIHSYGPVYEKLLSPLLRKSCTILEIGVAHGGSMMLWHKLCSKAYVIGLDTVNAVHPNIFPRMKEDQFSYLMGDAYTVEKVQEVKALAPDGIDFAIDDGPHSLESQCQFLQLYVPLLKKNGIAVIEDVQDFGWFDILKNHLPEDCACEIVDRRSVKGRYDDLMFVVTKQ